MSKIIKSWWFTPMNAALVGIVEVKTSHGEHRFYIGTASGINKKKDEEFIKNFGAPFEPKIFEVQDAN